ncbi:MAG: tRNA (adenosine(37)-N6)-dimethylallyltransferase MiaA [Synoicihabitans sp.]
MNESPTLYFLTGPTAVGKTELSLRWAETNDAEIVSCDSLLFYRGMDIGTAKPTREELNRVPHHLIDILPVDQPMTIAAYIERARSCVAEIQSRGKRVLVTGGSGFYLKAFLAPVVDAVNVPPELREEIERRLSDEGLVPLVQDLRGLNPDGLGSLDVANPRRVVRALERCRASGRTLAELKTEFEAQSSAFAEYASRGVCLTRDTDDLNARIVRRVDQMIAAGLVEEVRALLDRGLAQNASAARSIGYRESIALLQGEISAEEHPALIVKNTKSLVRKQRTWFRNQLSGFAMKAAVDAQPETLFAVD